MEFSDKAKEELGNYINALQEIVGITTRCFCTRNIPMARKVEPLEEVINVINAKAKKRHIKRLQKGKCTIAASVYYEDLLTNLERVSDHCSNVAIGLIQSREDSYEAHTYASALKQEECTGVPPDVCGNSAQEISCLMLLCYLYQKSWIPARGFGIFSETSGGNFLTGSVAF